MTAGENRFLQGFSHLCSEHLPRAGKEQHQSTQGTSFGNCSTARRQTIISVAVRWVWTRRCGGSFIFLWFSVKINFLLLHGNAPWNVQWFQTVPGIIYKFSKSTNIFLYTLQHGFSSAIDETIEGLFHTRMVVTWVSPWNENACLVTKHENLCLLR